MALIELRRAAKSYATTPILRDGDLRIHRGEKLGLVGADGCGKSTLLRIMAGVEELSAGTLALPSDPDSGYLPQDPSPQAPEHTLIQVVAGSLAPVVDLGQRREALERLMASATQQSTGARARTLEEYGRVCAEFEERGGYDLERRLDAVLDGLDLAQYREQRLDTLGASEQSRAALARVLLAKTEVLLLDEPAASLDAPAVDWLAAFLRQSSRTLVLVSTHGRLLNEVATGILEIQGQRLSRFVGNYSAYCAAKERQPQGAGEPTAGGRQQDPRARGEQQEAERLGDAQQRDGRLHGEQRNTRGQRRVQRAEKRRAARRQRRLGR